MQLMLIRTEKKKKKKEKANHLSLSHRSKKRK